MAGCYHSVEGPARRGPPGDYRFHGAWWCMTARILADLVLLVHLGWIAFILGGLCWARRRPWLARAHLVSLALVLALNLGGWYCPLTLLEAWLRGLAPGQAGYPGSFLFTYLDRLVYLRLPEAWLRAAGAAWAMLNLGGHAWLLARGRRERPLDKARPGP